MLRTFSVLGLAAVLVACPADPEPPDAFTVTLTAASLTEGSGTVENAALVELNRPAVEPVEISVQSSDEARLLPSDEAPMIGPGEVSAFVDLVVVEDTVIRDDGTVTLTVAAAGAAPQTFDVEVVDNDSVVLSLAVQDAVVGEGSGALTDHAVVSTGGIMGYDLEVDVSVDDTTELAAPDTVTVLAGTDEVRFALDAVDDALLDFDQSVTLTAAAGAQTDTVELTVTDDESAALTLEVPGPVGEGAGDVVGTVGTSAPVEEPLQITLVSADPAQLEVTAMVSLEAGASMASVTLAAVNDEDADFDVEVDVTASASGCEDGVVPVAVLDDESGYAIELMGPTDADEHWVDFGAMSGFMAGTDWAIVSTFAVPEGASRAGYSYQWMRGSAFDDLPGDITGDMRATQVGDTAEWVPGAWVVGHSPIAMDPEEDGPQITEDDGWHTTVVQYDATAEVMSLYVDGTLVARTDQPGDDDSANTNRLVWGGQWATPDFGIGDLYRETETTFLHQAWLQRLLTPAEIMAYDGSVDLDDPAVFFATAIGRDGLLDVSGGGRHGVVHGEAVLYRP